MFELILLQRTLKQATSISLLTKHYKMKKTLFPLLALVALFAAQCSKSAFSLPFGKELKVTELLGPAVPATAGIGFKFDQAAQKIMGNGGCNKFSAPFTLDGTNLSFGNAMSTKMACPNLELESKFMSALSQVKSIKKVGSNFQLRDGAGKVLAALAQ
jgi:heat shock protein HslJ